MVNAYNRAMIIFGFDPGYHRVGWSVLERTNSGAPRAIAYGCIETDKKEDLPERLQQIYHEAKQQLKKYKPAVVVIEKLYFAQSVTTALKVSEARGVLLLATAELKIPVLELLPSQVKQSLTGFGGAKKMQMQEMVRHVLGLKEIPKPDDAADALACAFAGSIRLRGR